MTIENDLPLAPIEAIDRMEEQLRQITSSSAEISSQRSYKIGNVIMKGLSLYLSGLKYDPFSHFLLPVQFLKQPEEHQ